MPLGQSVILFVGFALPTLIFVALFIASLYGWDIDCFERYKTTAPKQYENLKRVCKYNGPLVVLLSIGGLIALPFELFGPDGSILAALALLPLLVIALWLSIRWFLWSLRR